MPKLSLRSRLGICLRNGGVDTSSGSASGSVGLDTSSGSFQVKGTEKFKTRDHIPNDYKTIQLAFDKFLVHNILALAGEEIWKRVLENRHPLWCWDKGWFQSVTYSQ